MENFLRTISGTFLGLVLASCTLKLETSVYEGTFTAETSAVDDSTLSCKITYKEMHADKLDRDTLKMNFFRSGNCVGDVFSSADLADEDGAVSFSPGAAGLYSYQIEQVYKGQTTLSSCLGHVLLGLPEVNLLSGTPPLSVGESSNFSLALSGSCIADGTTIQFASGSQSASTTCANSIWSLSVDLSSLGTGGHQGTLSGSFEGKTFSSEIGLVILPRSPSYSTSSIIAAPTELPYGNSTTLIVTLRDSQGVAKVGETVALAATGFGASLTQPLAVTDSSGTTTATLSASSPVSAIVSVTSPATVSGLTTTVTFTTLPAPTLSGVVTDGTFSSSLTATPTLSWPAATDAAGILRYEIAVGSTPGGTDLLSWTTISTSTSGVYTHGSAMFADGVTYFPSIRAVNTNSVVSSAIRGDGWTVDTLSPSMASVTFTVPSDTWSLTNTPPFTWTPATDAGSGVSDYEVKLGTTSGGNEITDWTSVGNVLTKSFSGLNLTRGSTYYPSLRAKDALGNYSTPIAGSGWTIFSELPTVDGQIKSMLRSGSSLFIGGSFSEIGPWTGSAIPLNATTGAVSWPNTANKSRVSGTVYTVISDGGTGFYIGGDFKYIGGVTRNNLARINGDGTLDSIFNPNVNGPVYSLANDGTNLYLGGEFTSVGSTARTNLASVDPTTGSLTSAFNVAVSGPIYALAIFSNGIYLGGNFATVGGIASPNLARVDISNVGAPVDTAFAPNIQGGEVRSLLIHPSGSSLYVGGSFSTVQGNSIDRLAYINSSTGAPNVSFNPSPDNTVFAIALNTSDLYIGGDFNYIGATPKEGVARLNATTGVLNTVFTATTNSVRALAVANSKLYVSGQFNYVRSSTRYSLAAVALTNGLPNGTFLVPNSFSEGDSAVTFYAFAVNNFNSILAGGTASSIPSTFRSSSAKINMATGLVDSTFNASIGGDIYTQLLDSSRIFVGGSISSVNGTGVQNLAAVDSTTGALDATFAPFADSWVYSLAKDSTGLYVGGSFITIGGSSFNYLARLNDVDGTADASFAPNPDREVLILSLKAADLYVGGSFLGIGGQNIQRLAKVSTASGAVDTAFNFAPDGGVMALAFSGANNFFVGGLFTQFAAQTRRSTALIKLSDNTLDTGFVANTTGGTVSWMGVDSQKLYLIGNFANVNGVPQSFMARVDVITGTLDSSFVVSPRFAPSTSVFLNDSIVLAGNSLSGSEFKTKGLCLIPVSKTDGSSLLGF